MAKKISELDDASINLTSIKNGSYDTIDVPAVVGYARDPNPDQTKKVNLKNVIMEMVADYSSGSGGGGAILTDVVEISSQTKMGETTETYTYKGNTYNDVTSLYNSNTDLLRSIFFVKATYAQSMGPSTVYHCLGTLYKIDARTGYPDTYEIKLLK